MYIYNNDYKLLCNYNYCVLLNMAYEAYRKLRKTRMNLRSKPKKKFRSRKSRKSRKSKKSTRSMRFGKGPKCSRCSRTSCQTVSLSPSVFKSDREYMNAFYSGKADRHFCSGHKVNPLYLRKGETIIRDEC